MKSEFDNHLPKRLQDEPGLEYRWPKSKEEAADTGETMGNADLGVLVAPSSSIFIRPVVDIEQ